VCAAIASLSTHHITDWAERFAVLGDPRRLSLLVCLSRSGPMAVTDLALATGTRDTGVSQVLRLLRTAGIVAGERDGRVVRYHLVDNDMIDLLSLLDTIDVEQ
jgi:DNA-binding transcriptional ArsR family regulator